MHTAELDFAVGRTLRSQTDSKMSDFLVFVLAAGAAAVPGAAAASPASAPASTASPAPAQDPVAPGAGAAAAAAANGEYGLAPKSVEELVSRFLLPVTDDWHYNF